MNNSNFLLFCTESTGGEIRSYCYQLTFLWLGSYHFKVAFKLFYLTVLTITLISSISHRISCFLSYLDPGPTNYFYKRRSKTRMIAHKTSRPPAINTLI